MRVLIFIMLLVTLGCTSQLNSNIITLNLSNHSLSAIPDNVFSLTKLESLQLGNSFTLYPPLSAFGNDKHSGNNLNSITKISNEIERLKNLRSLGVCFNDLQSLPKELSKLKNLDSLDISFNQNLNVAAELETLKKMHRLKYLNIVATKSDKKSIQELRKSLANTKIVANFEEFSVEHLQ